MRRLMRRYWAGVRCVRYHRPGARTAAAAGFFMCKLYDKKRLGHRLTATDRSTTHARSRYRDRRSIGVSRSRRGRSTCFDAIGSISISSLMVLKLERI